MNPERYHRVLLALDQAVLACRGPSANRSPDDEALLERLELIRSQVLKAESGHPFLLKGSPMRSQAAAPVPWGPRSASGLPDTAHRKRSNAVRLMIVDDHEGVRSMLRAMLTNEGGFDVIAEASNGQEAVALAGACHPEVIIMDLEMPSLDGFSATREVLRTAPATKVIAFSGSDDPSAVRMSAEAGAVGYLSKPATRKEILGALRAVRQGRTAFHELEAFSDSPTR